LTLPCIPKLPNTASSLPARFLGEPKGVAFFPSFGPPIVAYQWFRAPDREPPNRGKKRIANQFLPGFAAFAAIVPGC
jgi:hypothetical protein